MTCETTRDQFSEYYDGGLTSTERSGLEVHLKECSACTGEYDQFSTSLKMLSDSGHAETTQVFLSKLREAAEQHLVESARIEKAPVAPAPVVKVRRETPVWVPFVLVGTTLGAFALGFILEDRVRRRDVAELREEIGRLSNRPAEVVRVVEPVDETKLLVAHGLIEVD